MTLEPPLRLNLGCGKDVRRGWTNVDLHGGPGVEPWDIAHLPLPDASVVEVMALHVLEHGEDRVAVIKEVHRVLRPEGMFTVSVPHGLWSLFNAFHRWPFDETTMDLFCRDDPRSSEPQPLFDKFAVKITSRKWPFWHLRKHLGLPVPLGRKEEVTYWLTKRR